MENLALSIPGAKGEGGGQFLAPSNIPSGQNTIPNLIQSSLNILILMGVVLTLIFLIYSGILWTTSGGDKQKLESARKTLTYAIIGIIVIACSFVIIGIIGQFLGLESLTNFGK